MRSCRARVKKKQELFGLFGDDASTSEYDSYVADIHGRDVEIRSGDRLEKITQLSSVSLDRLLRQFKRFLDPSLSVVKLKQLQNPYSSIRVRAWLLNTLQPDHLFRALLADQILHIRQSDESATKYNYFTSRGMG